MMREPITSDPNRIYLKVSGFSALVFLVMTLAMFYPPIKQYSGELTFKVMYARPVIWTEIMFVITHLGSASYLAGMTAATAVALALAKSWRDVLYLAVTMILVPIVLIFVKAVLSQNPPSSVAEIFELNTLLTYPSDYAFGAAGFFSAVAIIASDKCKSSTTRGWIVFGLAAVVLLIGVSRVFHGRSYPADIVAALSLGVALASFMRYALGLLFLRLKS